MSCLKDYVRHVGVDQAFDLHPYGSLRKEQAASSAGLAAAFPLLVRLHKVEASLRLKYRPVKDALAELEAVWPELAEGARGKKMQEWKGQTADCVLTVLNHAKRLKDETRFKEVISKASGAERATLTALRKLVAEGSVEAVEEPSTPRKDPVCNRAGAALEPLAPHRMRLCTN